jgi:hypothetical protein
MMPLLLNLKSMNCFKSIEPAIFQLGVVLASVTKVAGRAGENVPPASRTSPDCGFPAFGSARERFVARGIWMGRSVIGQCATSEQRVEAVSYRFYI